MLAVRDQENVVFGHQGRSQLLPKTPGARYPKTPLKVPLRDENATPGFGPGKSVLGGRAGPSNENLMTGRTGKAGKPGLVTPLGTSVCTQDLSTLHCRWFRSLPCTDRSG